MQAPAAAGADRLLPLDLLKGLAALLIVAHHAMLYGPLAVAAEAEAPVLARWLQQYGRYAVQFFLVAGGFLALRGLLRSRSPVPALLARRHARLALPLLAALVLTLLVHALSADALPDQLPTDTRLANWLAHALLLHGLLGMDSLSVGVWYVAIDFQLYALLALLVLLARRGWPLSVLLAVGVLASAWGFNRDPAGDDWAPYFFAAYGLGALAALPGSRHRQGLWFIAAAVALALLFDFRGRLLLALGCALALNAWADRPLPGALLRSGAAWLAERSYALFLLHYALLLLVNLGYLAWGGPAWLWLPAGLLLALVVADLFHRGLERRLARWDPLAAWQRLRDRPLRAWRLLPLLAAGWGLEQLLA